MHAGVSRSPWWKQNAWLAAITITVAALALVIIRNELRPGPRHELPSLGSDNLEYYRMAQGDTQSVISPFSRRVLYPLMARCLSNATGLSIPSSFILLTTVSVLLLAYLLARFLLLFDLSPWVAAIFILTPFSLDRMENAYMPDLFHCLLTAFFFFLVLRKQFLASLAVLAIAYMTRENTLILCLVFGVMAWLRHLYRIAMGSGLVIVFGTAFGSWAVRAGQPNIHHLPDFLYLGLKMPHQFLKNVLGFRIWTDTLPFGEPFKKIILPDYLRAGDVHVIGLCYPEWNCPLFTLISLLTLFGAGPLIVWSTRRLRLWTAPHPFAIQVVFVYGVISFFLGTSIGDWIDRLIGYGWPLFWIGVPYILAIMKQQKQDDLLKWSLMALGIIAWIPTFLSYGRESSLSISLATLLITVLSYAICWPKFRKNDLQFDPQHPVVP